ncbi:MAG: hypothetical protein SPL13_03460 [Clostridia bacterium]|nr:hypothetical protein [Clostridia bacterium]
MKKLLALLISLVMVFAAFAMVGCGESGDNYVEANAEQKETIMQRFNSIAQAEEENAEIVGLKTVGKITMTMSAGKQNISSEVNFTIKTDDSDSTDRIYQNVRAVMNSAEFATMTMFAEKDVETDDYLAYVTAIMTQPTRNTIKAKTYLSGVDSISELESVSEFVNMLKEQKTYGMTDIIELINNSQGNVKIYMDGENNIKIVADMSLDFNDMFNVEGGEGGEVSGSSEAAPTLTMEMSFIVKLDDNDNYSIELNSTTKMEGMNTTVNMTMTPSTEKVSMPTDTSDYVDYTA